MKTIDKLIDKLIEDKLIEVKTIDKVIAGTGKAYVKSQNRANSVDYKWLEWWASQSCESTE